MWQKIKALVQTQHAERLGWAILISMLLHAWLFGGADWRLPSMPKAFHTIEARIQLPKVAPEQAPEPAPPAEPKPQPPAKQEPQPLPQAPISPPESTPAPAPAPEVVESVVEPPPQADAPLEPQENKVTDEPTPPSSDAGLVINPDAHTYVEIYYDVSTKIDGPAEGQATMIFNLKDETNYEITHHAKADGFAGLFLSEYTQRSEGQLTKNGLRPNHYLSQYGTNEDKRYEATFDWQGMSLTMQTKKGAKTEPLPLGTQDLLSFMYQFMYIPPLEVMEIPITNGKKLRTYQYQFEGEEPLANKLGELTVVHISRTGLDPEDKTDLWLAPSYQYIPVKIRKSDKDGRIYELSATRVVTSRPTIDQAAKPIPIP